LHNGGGTNAGHITLGYGNFVRIPSVCGVAASLTIPVPITPMGSLAVDMLEALVALFGGIDSPICNAPFVNRK
jgi:hypothetical protein